MEAGRKILVEAIYLTGLLILSTFLISIFWWAPNLVGLDIAYNPDSAFTTKEDEFQHFALALLSGMLGGAAFAMKWLHHSVGLGPRSDAQPNGWTMDRRLWRFFVPVLSGVMAAVFYAALQSGLLNLEITTDNESAFAVAAGFLVGYFSDRAAAKLRDVAYVLFGTEGDPKPK